MGPGVGDALRGIAALGVPLGIVSNSTGEVEQALRRLDVCFAPGGGAAFAGAGIEVGVVIDSAVVGVSKPDPAIFALALDALGLPDVKRSTVVHVGDSLRYDVTGAPRPGSGPSTWTRTAIAPPRTGMSTSAASTRSSPSGPPVDPRAPASVTLAI